MQFKDYVFIIFAIFIFCVILPFFIIYLYCIIFYPRLQKPVKCDKLLNMMDKFQNGDLLFMQGFSYLENGICALQQGPFSHICMVVRNNNQKIPLRKQLFIIDVEAHPNPEKSGVHIMPLIEKLLLLRKKGKKIKTLYIEWHSIDYPEEKKPTYNDLVEYNKKYSYINRNTLFFNWFFSEYKRIENFLKIKDTMFCSEFIIKLMEDFNLVKCMKNYSYYVPEKIRTGQNIIYPPYGSYKNQGIFKF